MKNHNLEKVPRHRQVAKLQLKKYNCVYLLLKLKCIPWTCHQQARLHPSQTDCKVLAVANSAAPRNITELKIIGSSFLAWLSINWLLCTSCCQNVYPGFGVASSRKEALAEIKGLLLLVHYDGSKPFCSSWQRSSGQNVLHLELTQWSCWLYLIVIYELAGEAGRLPQH